MNVLVTALDGCHHFIPISFHVRAVCVDVRVQASLAKYFFACNDVL